MKLFTHQLDGAAWLAAHGKAQLGDTPGLGKTYTAIEALRLKGATRPLIVCPAIARTHWARSVEAADYSGAARIMSFEGVVAGGLPLMASLIHTHKIDALVIDESQYCKTATSQRAKILLGNDGYARRLQHVIALSGSIPKHPGELFNLVCALRPDLLVERRLTTREAWMNHFTIRQYRTIRGVTTEKVVAQQHTAELRELLSHVLLRRTLEDTGLDVPSLWWQTVALDGATDEAALATNMKTALAVRTALARETLESIAADPEISRMRRRIGELKAPLVVEMLKQQLEGTEEKIVVFAHHTSVLHALRDGLKEFGVAYVDGSTSDRQRTIEIDDFQNNVTPRVFIGQNIACRFSITLTAATRAVLVEPSWTADDNAQMGRRIARIGSAAEKCTAQMIALAGTLDEAIVTQNERETRMSEELFLKEAVM